MRSIRPEVLCKKAVLKKSEKFTWKSLPRLATLFKRRPQNRCFSVNFTKCLRTPFYIEHRRWLFLKCSLLSCGFQKVVLKQINLNFYFNISLWYLRGLLKTSWCTAKLLSTNCLSVFDHFVGVALKRSIKRFCRFLKKFNKY